jgi:hypothetical protein
MNRTTFLIIAAIITALFGIGLLLAPGQLAATYGTTFNPGGTAIARIGGSSLIALAWIIWGARNGPGAEAMQAVLVAGVVANVLNILISGQATMNGVIGNGIGWATVALHILLTLGFGYFAFVKR